SAFPDGHPVPVMWWQMRLSWSNSEGITKPALCAGLRLLTNPAEKPLGLYANWKKIEKNRRIKDPPWGPLFLFQRSKAIFLMFWQTAVRRHCSVTLASPLIRA